MLPNRTKQDREFIWQDHYKKSLQLQYFFYNILGVNSNIKQKSIEKNGVSKIIIDIFLMLKLILKIKVDSSILTSLLNFYDTFNKNVINIDFFNKY